MKKNIITIAGELGSGKSTTADLVAKMLDYERFSSGFIMRKMAEKRGVSIVEMNQLAEEDELIDKEVDTSIQVIGQEKNNLVIDSRTAWHWIPDSFKVYLSLSPEVAAVRIFKSIQSSGDRNKTENWTSVDDVKEKTQLRAESEQKRFKERYNIDPRDTSQFDLVINTNDTPPQTIAENVVKAYKKWRLL